MNVLFKKEGFTLIELLTVIAIIGLLSAVVVTTLSDSRDRAVDRRGVGALESIRSSMFEAQGNNGNFQLLSDIDNGNVAYINEFIGTEEGEFQIGTSTTVISPEFCVSYRSILPENPPTVYYVIDQNGARPASSSC